MADFVYGDSFGDVSRQETQRRQLADERFFQTLANNRAVSAAAQAAEQNRLNNLFTQIQLRNQMQAGQAARANAASNRQQDLALNAMREAGLNRRASQALQAGQEESRLRYGDQNARREESVQNNALNAAVDAFNRFGGDPDATSKAFNLAPETMKQFQTIVSGATRLQDEANRRNEGYVSEANKTLDVAENASNQLLEILNNEELNRDALTQKALAILQKNRLPVDTTKIIQDIAMGDKTTARATVSALPQQIFSTYAKALQQSGAATLDDSGRRFNPILSTRFKPFGNQQGSQEEPTVAPGPAAPPAPAAPQVPAPFAPRPTVSSGVNRPYNVQRAQELKALIEARNPGIDPNAVVREVARLLKFEEINPRPVAIAQ